MLWVTWLLFVPDPYATAQVFKPVKRAQLSDFTLHATAYLGLCLILHGGTCSFRQINPRVIAILGVHAVATELMQMLAPARVPEVVDVIANFTGITAGVVMLRTTRCFTARFALR